MRSLLALTILLLSAGFVLGASTIIQGPNIFTGFIDATSLVVNEITGHKVTGQVSLESNKIVNVQDPVNPQDAATKAYVDRVANGGGGGSGGGEGVTTSIEAPVSLYSPENGPYSLPEINGEDPTELDYGYVFVGEENAYMVVSSTNRTTTKYIAVFHLPALKYTKTVQIPLNTFGSSVHGIEFGGFLYVADGDEMLRYSMENGVWERLPIPAGKTASFFTRTDSKLLFGSYSCTSQFLGSCSSAAYEMFRFDFAAKNWSFMKTIPQLITRSDSFAGYNPARLITHQGETVYGIKGDGDTTGDSVGSIVAFNTNDLSTKIVDTRLREKCLSTDVAPDVDVLEVQAKDNSLFVTVIGKCTFGTFMLKTNLPLPNKSSLDSTDYKTYKLASAITGSTQYYGVEGVSITNVQNPDRIYQIADRGLHIYDGNFSLLRTINFGPATGILYIDSANYFFWRNLFVHLRDTTYVIKAY